MKIDRLLSITMVLINKKRVQAKDLAEMFDVSVRTIYRDIDAINQSGIPIITYQGSNGGIGIAEGYKLDKNVLTNDEMTSMLVALKSVGSSYHSLGVSSIIEKFKSILNFKETQEFKAKTESIFIDFSPWNTELHLQEKIERLKNAIHQSKLVIFTYCNTKGEESGREVEPHTLVMKGQKWYLYGYCKSKNAFRLFKLSRIKDLQVSIKEFIRHDIDLEKLPWGQDWIKPKSTINLVLQFNKNMKVIIEECFGVDNIHLNTNGRYRVSLSIPEDNWLYGFILSFGSQVEVLEPSHLREKIGTLAKEVNSIYENN